MDSPIFEPTDDCELDQTALLPGPDLSLDVGSAPMAYMYPAAPPGTNAQKRKFSDLDPEIATHFEKLSKDYPGLDADSQACHDPNSEPLPKLPIYHASFDKAANMAKGIIRGLQETVLLSGDQDEESNYMKECLAQLAVPAHPKPQVTCLYGNCGVGKSSLINASLGVEGASLKTGDGGSGTLVPIDFVQAVEKQRGPHVAYVFYFPSPGCGDIVKTAFANYYDSRLAPTENLSKDISAIDLGKTALKMLMALFADKPEFEDEEAAVRFLSRAVSADDPKILSRLLAWTRSILDELAKLGSVACICRNTAADLNRALEPFTQQTDFPEIEGTALDCSVWPFVRLVKKSLSNPVLAKGNVLVDLPGVSDGNQHRVQLANSYFRRCDQAIVVHSIERAEDEGCVEQYILNVFRRKRNGSVAVVLTRADDIEQEISGRIRYTPQQQAQLRSLDEYEKEVKEELRTVRQKLSRGSPSDFLRELTHKQGLYMFLQKNIKRKRTEILVAARNAKVRKTLQDWYRTKTNDPQELPVFCVSSKCYMEHIRGFSPVEPPLLSATMTEIPHVRSYLFSLANKAGKVDILKHYCAQVRSLLNQMELSCIGFKPMMKRDHLLKIVHGARKGISKQFDAVHQELCKRSITPILVKFDASEDSWLREAGNLCDRWSRYTYAGHVAFMKHEGNWKTAACGKANWNASLLDVARDDIQPLLDQFYVEGCYIFKIEAMQALGDLLDQMEQDMKDNLDYAQTKAFEGFFDSIRDRKKVMGNIIDETTKTLRHQILLLNNDTLNDGPNSPFTHKMSKIYKESIKAEPDKLRRTKHAARCAYFRDSVCLRKAGPFMAIKRYLEKGFNKVMDDADKSMVVQCETVLDAIMHDFNQVCPEREDNGVQALKRRETLGKKVKDGRDELEGPVRNTLLQCGVAMD